MTNEEKKQLARDVRDGENLIQQEYWDGRNKAYFEEPEVIKTEGGND